jgi:Dolichyl-phosphate-mannose-protein mannosyltransferase
VLLFSTLGLLLAFIVARRARDASRLETVERTLRRLGPPAAAALTVITVWYVWGALRPVPTVQDEASYLLQADIFAHGRWTAHSPPIPEFFEQPHVLVVPTVASKYPPGHALLLSLGALLHFPPLVPLMLAGATAALLFALAARVFNVWVASLASAIWIPAPMVLRFESSYLSEVSTTTIVLLCWWLLLAWRADHRTRWLVLLGLAVGWGAITRPLTMLAFAMPLAFVVLRDAHRLKTWRPVVASAVVTVAVLSLLPLWSVRTTGDWQLTPLELYRRDYLPFDKYGFTPDTSPPTRGVPPALKSAYDYYRHERIVQRPSALPRVAAERAFNVVVGFFQGARLPLILFALIGLARMNGALRFAAGSALLVFLAHLPYAHWSEWTVYYLETTPTLAALTAVGLWWALCRVAGDAARARSGAAIALAVLLLMTPPIAVKWRRDHATRSRLDRSFAAAIATLPQRSIVFIHYTPRSAEHLSVVMNHADLAGAPIWVVHDLGARNEELKRLAPDRATFDFDEDQLVGRR